MIFNTTLELLLSLPEFLFTPAFFSSLYPNLRHSLFEMNINLALYFNLFFLRLPFFFPLFFFFYPIQDFASFGINFSFFIYWKKKILSFVLAFVFQFWIICLFPFFMARSKRHVYFYFIFRLITILQYLHSITWSTRRCTMQFFAYFVFLLECLMHC